jgi:FtsP/CotA-like multicopper oxidase with cupredoxin domain
MNKRQFLIGGLGAAAIATTGYSFVTPRNGRASAISVHAFTGPRREMPIPRLIETVSGQPIELTMGQGEFELLPGVKTPTMGFNGPYLGPTVRVRDGQNVPITYRNNCSEAIAIHGHGLHVPGGLDGGPQREIEPGDSWSLELPIRQQASTSWYHPHTHHKTGPQTYNGLAGMFVIDDENSDALPLPKTYGVDDIPIIIQDRTFDEQGRLDYFIEDAEDGMLGDTITANGIANATRSVPAGLVRLRLLNGANARYFRFRFSDNREFHKIATDGGFLEEPVPIRELLMTPGERNEVVIDFSNGNPAMLVSGPSTLTANKTRRRDEDQRDRRRSREPGGLEDSFEVLQFTVNPDLPAVRGSLPRQLNSISRPTILRSWPVRRFDLFMRDNRRRDVLGAFQDNTEMSMGINRQSLDMQVINERVRLGQWERWVINSFDGSHPFHVHGCSFLVLAQNEQPVAIENAGWKDTVRVDDSAEFIVRFNHKATDEFPYMYHCHILEHEDRGMMGQFTVA